VGLQQQSQSIRRGVVRPTKQHSLLRHGRSTAPARTANELRAAESAEPRGLPDFVARFTVRPNPSFNPDPLRQAL